MGISDRAKRKASAGVQQRIDNEKETRSEKSHNKQIADKKIQDKLKRDGNAAVAKATASIGIKYVPLAHSSRNHSTKGELTIFFPSGEQGLNRCSLIPSINLPQQEP